MKQKLPEVLEKRCRHFFEERWPEQTPVEINTYKLQVMTGLGQGTCIRLMNDENYIPNGHVLDVLCEAFGLQPGDFLYHERTKKLVVAKG